MATKADKKNAIRQDIIDSAAIYSQSLAGKAFLYVYGEDFFEVSFPVDHFLHLTGVETKLSAKDFYKNCLLYTSPSPRDMRRSRMPSSA